MTVKVLRDSKNMADSSKPPLMVPLTEEEIPGASGSLGILWLARLFAFLKMFFTVLNTARLVRHFWWSSSCPSDQSREALRSLIVPVRIRATRNCSESPKVARNTGSCQKVAEQLVESRPWFRESTLTASSSLLSFTNDCLWQCCSDILPGHQY